MRSCSAIESLESRSLLASTPFPSSKPVLPSNTVLFANYDNGGEGVAYHDADRANLGGEYRRREGVDVERITDIATSDFGGAPGAGRAVGHVRAGEWLKYSINVSASGHYQFDLRYAVGSTGGTAHLEVDGTDMTGSIDLANTGSWKAWRTFIKTDVALAAGNHTLRFVIDSGSGDVVNLNWFRFVASTSNLPAGGGSTVVPWPTAWSRIKDTPAAKFEAMSHPFGGNVYIFGGYRNSGFQVDRSYQIYNPTTNRWKTLGTLPVGMAETHITPADDGKYIYFVGGFAGDLRHGGVKPVQIASDRVWRFDPAHNTWSELPHIPVPQGAGGAAILGHELHFMGGNSADRVTNVSQHYVLDLDDTSRGWSRLRSMPDAKDHFSTVALNGKIYTLGGEYGHDDLFDTQSSVYVYEPRKDRWKRLADMPLPSGHAEGSTFAYDSHIVFAGGQTKDQTASNRVFAYDPIANTWSELTALPQLLQGSSVSVIGSRVLVTLGAQFTVNPLASTYVGDLQ